jgi:phospholipase/carboxylesterase
MYAWFPLTDVGEELGYDPADLLTARKVLQDFLTATRKDVVHENTPIVLIGFSQGGALAYDAAFSSPSLVSGVAALSGTLLPETRQRIDETKKKTVLPFFIGHGTGDTVLPVRHARDAKKFLENAGYSPQYKEYPMEHSISPMEVRDLAEWIQSSFTQ